MRRGQVSVQFNWIFVLIIGAIILGFFTYVATKIVDINDRKIEVAVRTDIKSVLTGQRAATLTEALVEKPDIDILFDEEGYRIGKQNAFSSLSSFSPSVISGRYISTWSQPWYAPYPVTNFLYATSPGVRYIFVGDDNLVNELYEAMPNQTIQVSDGYSAQFFSKEKCLPGGFGSLEDLGHYKARIIIVDQECGQYTMPSGFKLRGDDYTVLKIMPTQEGLEGYGKLVFCSKPGAIAQKESRYLGKASLFGAIFADNGLAYESSMNNSFGTYKLVTEILKTRSENIQGRLSAPNDVDCAAVHTNANSAFDDIYQNIENGFTEADFGALWISMGEARNALGQGINNSCPEVY